MAQQYDFYRQIPLQIPHQYANEHSSKPRVLIAGGGIGGLTLGILLKKAGVPFEIFERNYGINDRGSAIALGVSVTPLLQQLGLYDDLLKIAKPINEVNVITDDMEPVYTMNLSSLKEATTYPSFIVSRPDLYNLLRKQIPEENMCFGKSFYNFDQDKKSVVVRFSDTTKYYCDILVGADGAHSTVRENILRRKEDELPSSDTAPLPYGCICLVGQTDVLDPEEFPDLKNEFCKDYSVLGTNSKYSWCTFTTKKNTLCWMVIEFLDRKATSEDEHLRRSDWGANAEDMCNKVRDFKIPGGKDGKAHTIGDLIDKTPKELISKVMLEEKLFRTWHLGRVVLLGDACHRLIPSGGVGAASAMHDAVALANWIVSMESPSMVDVNEAFKEYYAERFPIVQEEFEQNQGFTSILGKGVVSAITRSVLRWLPDSVWEGKIAKMSMVRPQASFLPLVEEKGTLELAPQPSLTKTLPIIQKRALAKERAAKRSASTVAAV
ncbi:hypothetical protein MVEG_07555 [Podila verticillata NRRL 6337]|nr:hypothetical protein MVEG_07555 [Podila verticillata NRRL 6337]